MRLNLEDAYLVAPRVEGFADHVALVLICSPHAVKLQFLWVHAWLCQDPTLLPLQMLILPAHVRRQDIRSDFVTPFG